MLHELLSNKGTSLEIVQAVRKTYCGHNRHNNSGKGIEKKYWLYCCFLKSIMDNQTSTVVSMLWAKMAGFAYWPARYCTTHEKSVLDKGKSSKKANYMAVIFLGSSYQR